MRITPSAPLAVIITAVAALITFLVTTGADTDGTPTTPPSGGRTGSPHPATTTLRGRPPVPATDPRHPHDTTAPQADEDTQSTSTKPPTGPVAAPPTTEGTSGSGGDSAGNGPGKGKGNNNAGGNGKGKAKGKLTPSG
jgi:hypothetical protein